MSQSIRPIDGFSVEADEIQTMLEELKLLRRGLSEANKTVKSLPSASDIEALRSRMESDVAAILKTSVLVKLRLRALDGRNASAAAGLKRKLVQAMESFYKLRETMMVEHGETVARWHHILTGEEANEEMLEALIRRGGERLLQRVIGGGKGNVEDVIVRIQEEGKGAMKLERSLLELRQVFDEMGALVEEQGEELGNIEAESERARLILELGNIEAESERARLILDKGGRELERAKGQRKNTKKYWACCFFIVFLLIVVVAVVAVLSILLNR